MAGAPIQTRIHCQPKILRPNIWEGSHWTVIAISWPPTHGPKVTPPMKPNCSSAKARVMTLGGKASAISE